MAVTIKLSDNDALRLSRLLGGLEDIAVRVIPDATASLEAGRDWALIGRATHTRLMSEGPFLTELRAIVDVNRRIARE